MANSQNKGNKMKTREQLSQENYQQAVKFAQHFADDVRQEFEREAEQRYQFERTQFEQSVLQNNAQNRPLAKIASLSCVAILLLAMTYYGLSDVIKWCNQVCNNIKIFNNRWAMHTAHRKMNAIFWVCKTSFENPNNGDLWYELGQAYALSNDFDSALVCYDNAEKLLGKRAAILGAIATARYYDNGQKMTVEIQAIIEQALQLDKNENASLLLLASDSF